MAPEETKMTLWPCDCNFMAVSTMTLRIERRGSWVVSSTMELVPVHYLLESAAIGFMWRFTEFDYDS